MSDLARWIGALHLASPALPVGGFSYSQGLEAAYEHGLVPNEQAAQAWIGAALAIALERLEAPGWVLLYRAWSSADWDAARTWNAWLLSARESAELRQESEQMGWSMVCLIDELAIGTPVARGALRALRPIGYTAAASFAYALSGIPEELGLAAYCFSWLENQVAAAVKIVPLGQAAGQRILSTLGNTLPASIARVRETVAARVPWLDTFAPQLAILSARHETQYSRLFRS